MACAPSTCITITICFHNNHHIYPYVQWFLLLAMCLQKEGAGCLGTPNIAAMTTALRSLRGKAFNLAQRTDGISMDFLHPKWQGNGTNKGVSLPPVAIIYLYD